MEVYILSDNMTTALGCTTKECIQAIEDGKSGIKIIHDKNLSPEVVPLGLVDHALIEKKLSAACTNITRLEKMAVWSVSDALADSGIDPGSEDTVFVFSSTKGNIDLLEKKKGEIADENIFLWKTAETISRFFGNPNKPITISNACVSGLVAMNVAADMLRSKKFSNAVVFGADILTKFVVSGFQSFKAISPEICRPFDINRDGISLGEGAGTVILSTVPKQSEAICLAGGGSSNDANHISGPSRTGDGLYFSIRQALKQACVDSSQIDYISAHGTATPYNDEMEAKALALANLENVPVNSMKAYFGHTLGAAGILESIVVINAMKKNLLYKSMGYAEHGVSVNIPVITENRNENISIALKTASGFGGCNAAGVFIKKQIQ